MKKADNELKKAALSVLIATIALTFLAAPAFSAEKYYEKTAENFIFMVDTSGSMKKEYQNTGTSRMTVLKEALEKANQQMPNLGYTSGLYVYTPWEAYVPVAPYNKAKFTDAINHIPRGYKESYLADPPSPLGLGMQKLGDVLDRLAGRTIVYLFTDGENSSNIDAVAAARDLVQKYDVCFTVISAAPADEPDKVQRVNAIANLNDCSQLYSFQDFINQPELCTGAVCEVKYAPEPAKKQMVVVSKPSDADGDGVPDASDNCPDTPSGYAVDANGCLIPITEEFKNIHFEFNEANIQPKYTADLNDVGMFMKKHPNANLIISGYTDSIGTQKYNLALSSRRAESARDYLIENFGLDKEKIEIRWYGELNPIASNDTDEGRRQNRRVTFDITNAYQLAGQ